MFWGIQRTLSKASGRKSASKYIVLQAAIDRSHPKGILARLGCHQIFNDECSVKYLRKSCGMHTVRLGRHFHDCRYCISCFWIRARQCLTSPPIGKFRKP